MNGAVRDCSMADVGMNLCVLGVNHVLNGFEVGNGPYDRSQIWDRIDARFFFEPRCSRSCFHGCLGVLCLICVLNVCLVCFGPGMAVDCGFTK